MPMLRTLLLSLCLLLPVGAFGHLTPEVHSLRQATKLVQLDNGGNGSGVVIAPNRVLTAAHVVAWNLAETGITVDGKPAKVIKVGKQEDGVDLALLSVKVACPCVSVTTRNVSVDDRVVVIGYPLGEIVASQVVTYGEVQNVIDKVKRLALNVSAYFGNSGGPVFKFGENGWRVVGILVEMAGYRYGPVPHLTRAVDPATIREFLK